MQIPRTSTWTVKWYLSEVGWRWYPRNFNILRACATFTRPHDSPVLCMDLRSHLRFAGENTPKTWLIRANFAIFYTWFNPILSKLIFSFLLSFNNPDLNIRILRYYIFSIRKISNSSEKHWINNVLLIYILIFHSKKIHIVRKHDVYFKGMYFKIHRFVPSLQLLPRKLNYLKYIQQARI